MMVEQPDFQMRRETLSEHPGGRIIIVDTIAHVRDEDAGQVVICGSHGGISSGEYASRVQASVVFFNDAGGGKEGAGAAALSLLEARGIAAGTVSHDSAMIGDALDAWENGTVSVLNARAQALGFAVGRPLRDTILSFVTRASDAQ